MKKLCIITLFLLLPAWCFAGSLQEKHRSVIAKKNAVVACTDANPVGNCTGFVVCANWETTAEACDPCSEDNSESWDKTIGGTGTITVDYGTALRGLQSLQIVSDGTTSSIAKTFSAQGTLYGVIKVKLADGRPASTNAILTISNDVPAIIYQVSVVAAGNVRVYNGTGFSASTTTLADGDTGARYIWFYVSKGTGADGTMGVAITETRTFTAWEDEDTSGTSTTDAVSVALKDRYSGGVVFDQVLLKITAIGTVCE